ncbi:hypothetical protein GYA49_02490 [Candidatus Beckwithbacteria bacterium]|nr:hypothetical protein [Candidatus Beckwithbacteria bacterium]
MGSVIEINDTLQITKEQGFPAELDIEKHLLHPYKTKDFKDKIFTFKNKTKIRVYKIPPVRNFLVENLNGKWIYWGLVHIVEISHDYLTQTTEGKFKIIYINTPEEMKMAHKLIDRNKDTNYFQK